GDPKFSEIPIAHLLAETYAAERRKLVGADAAFELRPGFVPGFEAQHDLTMTMRGADSKTGAVYEPTMAHLTEKRGDTVH
ncbi:gamma-glutamyltransferase family protein, partial [Rhizobium ruizarguesonis]